MARMILEDGDKKPEGIPTELDGNLYNEDPTLQNNKIDKGYFQKTLTSSSTLDGSISTRLKLSFFSFLKIPKSIFKIKWLNII